MCDCVAHGTGYDWELAEGQAGEVIAAIERRHLKPHGQSYWKLYYPIGTRAAFVVARGIRV